MLSWEISCDIWAQSSPRRRLGPFEYCFVGSWPMRPRLEHSYPATVARQLEACGISSIQDFTVAVPLQVTADLDRVWCHSSADGDYYPGSASNPSIESYHGRHARDCGRSTPFQRQGTHRPPQAGTCSLRPAPLYSAGGPAYLSF